MPQDMEEGEAIHLSLEQLEEVNLALGLAIARWRGHGGLDRRFVSAQLGREGADLGQAAGFGRLQPGGQGGTIVGPDQLAEIFGESLRLTNRRALVHEVGTVGPLVGVELIPGAQQEPAGLVWRGHPRRLRCRPSSQRAHGRGHVWSRWQDSLRRSWRRIGRRRCGIGPASGQIGLRSAWPSQREYSGPVSASRGVVGCGSIANLATKASH